MYLGRDGRIPSAKTNRACLSRRRIVRQLGHDGRNTSARTLKRRRQRRALCTAGSTRSRSSLGATRRDGHISATDTHPNCAAVKRWTDQFGRALLHAAETQAGHKPLALVPAEHKHAKQAKQAA